MSDRVVVFLDYQNVYRGARSCFHPFHSPHWNGQIDPVQLGALLAADSPFDRSLEQVRIYRGRPDATRDPKGYAACTRQVAHWCTDPRINVTMRTLRYPAGWPDQTLPGEKPQEKGIDVALALDFVTMAMRDEYDVGILMSTDTDMKPALEAVAALPGVRTPPRVEVAAWSAPMSHSRRLSVKTARLWCHWLDEAAYESVADKADYTQEL